MSDSPPRAGDNPRPNLIMALKHLGLMGALDSAVHVRSADLGEALGLSQQSASNLLVALEDEGLIERQMGSRGQNVRVTPEGAEILRREHNDYHAIFDRSGEMVIRGTVTTGLGEGLYYISQEGYRDQFRGILGFTPEHGTLNLSLEEEGIHQLIRLRDGAENLVRGFEKEGRTFGDVLCVPCRVRDSPAAVIIPVRTHHRDVMEVISPHRLRDRYGLSDGDEVEVRVGP